MFLVALLPHQQGLVVGAPGVVLVVGGSFYGFCCPRGRGSAIVLLPQGSTSGARGPPCAVSDAVVPSEVQEVILALETVYSSCPSALDIFEKLDMGHTGLLDLPEIQRVIDQLAQMPQYSNFKNPGLAQVMPPGPTPQHRPGGMPRQNRFHSPSVDRKVLGRGRGAWVPHHGRQAERR